MKLLNILLLLVVLMTGSACTPETPQTSPTPTNTNTPPPTSTHTPEPTSTPIPTFTPTSAPVTAALYTWPIPPLNDQQIQEVLDCQNETWSEDYQLDPETIQIETPATACEFGLKAISLISDFSNLELPPAGKRAAQQAILNNPGIIFANPYFLFAFQSVDIVNLPSAATSPLKEANIQYTWGGLGRETSFELLIRKEGTTIATGTVELGYDYNNEEVGPTSWEVNQEIDSATFQNFGASLTNLVPVRRQGQLFACFDNYPDWTIQFKYEDGAQLTLQSNESNFFIEGGPFQTQIEGQDYLLATYAFNINLLKIIEQLEIPLGEPAAMSCFPMPIAEFLLSEHPDFNP